MPIINRLDKDTISKIAAGEVVERPASVVKELIENALDAQAENITVFVQDGGIKEITIIDDGIGMDKDDVLECFKPHTTSKITSLHDLEDVGSFGFRGEALSSISSVSNFYIASRESESLEGYFVSLEAGELLDSGIVGMPIGTRVTVSDLFHNVPARRKYLKSSSEELRFISNVVTKMCIMHPEVSFKLVHNDSELINVNKDSNLENRLKNHFSSEFYYSLIPVKGALGDINVAGFVSRPEDARTAKFKQHLFVNKRSVRDNVVSDAVRSAYGSLTDSKKYPQFILFIDVPSKSVDVNIHPQKEKVRFLDKDNIHTFIRNTVTEALESKDLTPKKAGYSGVSAVLKDFSSEPMSSTNASSEGVLQVHDLYLIKEVSDGILVVDQHAAHERIIYEKLLSALNSQMDPYYTETLSDPYPLDLDDEDFLFIEENLETFEKLGIEIKRSSEGSAFEVVSVPYFMSGRNLQNIVREFLDSIRKDGVARELDSNTKVALSHMACRLAIKDGQRLEEAEITQLLLELEDSKTPYVCPHGRPAKVFIPNAEIGKWFRRP